MTDSIESLQAEISELRSLSKRTIDLLIAKNELLDALLFEDNKQYFGDFVWLLNNPNAPGQHEALTKWIKDNFGAYRGISTFGFNPKTNQRCFDISLRDDECIKNVRKFLNEWIDRFQPKEDGYVSFTYTTDEYEGIFDLAYRPENKTWWTTQLRYGEIVDETQHANLDEAIAEARIIILKIGEE